MSNSPQNLHKKILGKKGEKLVEKHLKKCGYKILHKNYRTPFGEADIIAQDKDEIVFVEVKTRTDEGFGAPREAVREDKKRRYRQMATAYLMRFEEQPNARFDVAEVYADGRIEYYKYAF